MGEHNDLAQRLINAEQWPQLESDILMDDVVAHIPRNNKGLPNLYDPTLHGHMIDAITEVSGVEGLLMSHDDVGWKVSLQDANERRTWRHTDLGIALAKALLHAWEEA